MGNVSFGKLGSAFSTICNGLDAFVEALFNRQPETEVHDNLLAKKLELEAQLKERKAASERMEVENRNLELRNMKMREEIGKIKMEAEMREMERIREIRMNGEIEDEMKGMEQEKLRIEELERGRAAKRRSLGIDNVKKFNYALTGQTGVGKSSLVNVFVGEEVAAVDFVECTATATAYPHREFPNLVIWDLPGAGTLDHPVETYYEDKVLHAFDAIIIVTGNRILNLELEIAKQSQEACKPVVFVRSKADSDIINMARDTDVTMAQAADEFRQSVHEDFQNQLLVAGLKNINLYIVSSWFFLHKRSPYHLSGDQSLERMDENLLMKFVLETATTRFRDSTDQVRAMEEMFHARVPKWKANASSS